MTIHQAIPDKERPMECEWCTDKASYKISASNYRRYACAKSEHRAKLQRLAQLDGHSRHDVELGYFTAEKP